MTKLRKKADFTGQKIYVGIDVHWNSWTVAFCLEDINYRPFTQAPDVELLIEHMTYYFPNGNYLCAYEAGFSGYVLFEQLQERGIPCVVIHPADVPTTDKESEFKADKIDALKIVKALRSGLLEGIAIPDKERQTDRALVRLRNQFKRDIVRQKSRIRSLLMFFGVRIHLPEEWAHSKFTEGMRNWLWNLKLCTKEGTKAIRLHMGMLEHIRGMCINTDNHLRALSRTPRHQKQVDLLMSVVGFGRLRSIEFIVSLGDIRRFKSLDKLSSYVGLVPASNNSGNRIRQRELTTRGHKQLRTMLIKGAHIADLHFVVLSINFLIN